MVKKVFKPIDLTKESVGYFLKKTINHIVLQALL